MAEFPALPIWTDAWLSDTRHLTAAEQGAYFLLVITAWRMHDCALPNSDKLLARWAAMDARTWQRHKAIVLAFWELGDDQKWRQAKLCDVRKDVEHVRSKKSAAGKSSSLIRNERRQRMLQHNGNGKVTNENENENHKLATSDDEICAEEMLPSRWHDLAEAKGIPDEQIYQSWRRFKNKTSHPYRLKNWAGWLARERINA